MFLKRGGLCSATWSPVFSKRGLACFQNATGEDVKRTCFAKRAFSVFCVLCSVFCVLRVLMHGLTPTNTMEPVVFCVLCFENAVVKRRCGKAMFQKRCVLCFGTR